MHTALLCLTIEFSERPRHTSWWFLQRELSPTLESHFLCFFFFVFGNGPNTVSESTVSNTEPRKLFGPHRVPGRELSEFLSACYLCAKANSPSFLQNSVSSLFRNSTLARFLDFGGTGYLWQTSWNIRERKKHINIYKFSGLSCVWVSDKILSMFFFRVIPYGEKKTHDKQNAPPPKKNRDNPVKNMFMCSFFMCFFVPKNRSEGGVQEPYLISTLRFVQTSSTSTPLLALEPALGFGLGLLGQESRRTKVSRIFRIFVPNFQFCPEFCSEFFPNFSRTFRASFRERRRPEKFTKNPRHFSMQNSQANTKKIFTKFFWRAGKVRFWVSLRLQA